MDGEIQDAFIGIDVAFAKNKVLPVSVCVRPKGKFLDILPLRVSFDKPPAGRGNVLALEDRVRRQFAKDVLTWIAKLERAKRLMVRRIAIDAPSDYCRDASGCTATIIFSASDNYKIDVSGRRRQHSFSPQTPFTQG